MAISRIAVHPIAALINIVHFEYSMLSDTSPLHAFQQEIPTVAVLPRNDICFMLHCADLMGIPTPVCALARNDMLFVGKV